MNNLAYGNQDIQGIAAKVEELLRKEVGASGPLQYQVEDDNAGPTNVGSVLRDVSASLFGGKGVGLCTIHFRLTQPRAADLDVHINRQGAGAFGGPLVYALALSKPVSGEISFGDDGKFAGDSAGAGKLNAVKDVLKKSNAFAVTQGGITGFELKIPRQLKITPQDGKSMLVAATLPRSKSMGFSATLNSREFFELAAQIETAL